MSKIVNRYSLGLTVAVGAALVAYFQSGSTIEDVGEQIALKLIEILPRKHQQHREFAAPPPQAPPQPSAARSPPPPAAAKQDQAGPLSKASIFDPVSPNYDPKAAMQARFDGLREVCAGFADFMRPERAAVTEGIKPKMDRLLFHPPTDISVCSVEGVATRTMETFFNRIREPGNEWSNKLKFFQNNFPSSVGDLRRAIVVRHPLERLVAAYRHNFEQVYNAGTGEYEGGEVTFPEFIDIVLNGFQEYADFLEENDITPGQSSVIDTGMIDGDGTSMAWDPIWRQCAVCNPDFMPHYILHLDHFKEDSAVLVELLEQPKNAGKFVGSGDAVAKSGLPEAEQHYWSQITKEDIRALYEKYKVDHDIFGFKPDYYIAFGKEDDSEEQQDD